MSENEKKHKKNSGLETIPKRFVGATIDTWLKANKLDPNQVHTPIQVYFDTIDNEWDRGRGLMLTGDPGRGKTYLACALMQRVEPKYRSLFITFPQFIRLVQRNFSASQLGDLEGYKQNEKALDTLRRKVDFLVIDDVGKEYRTTSGFAESELDYLLRRRFDLAFPTIVTTNLTPKDWTSIYGEPMGSFIHEAFIIAPVQGRDFRPAV